MPGVGASASVPNDGVEAVDLGDKSRQSTEGELAIRIRQKDQIATRCGKSAANRRAVTAIGGMCYQAYPRIADAQRLRHWMCAIDAAIVDYNDFVIEPQIVQRSRQEGDGRRKIFLLVESR